MKDNPLMKYSEQLTVEVEKMCKSLDNKKDNANTILQIRKSSSSVFANINFDISKRTEILAKLYCINQRISYKKPTVCLSGCTVGCIKFIQFILPVSSSIF